MRSHRAILSVKINRNIFVAFYCTNKMQNRCKKNSLYHMNRCYIIVKKNIELAVDEPMPGTLGAMHLIPYCKIHCSISDSLSFQFLSLLINSQSVVSVTVGAQHGMFFPPQPRLHIMSLYPQPPGADCFDAPIYSASLGSLHRKAGFPLFACPAALEN